MGMNTTVNNLKKELVVNFSKTEVESKMKFLCFDSEYYRSYDGSESVLGLHKYNFNKPISGLVDTGMQAHITLAEEGDNKTKICIEIVDNFGGTDGYDIDSSNILIKDITKSLSKILTTDLSTLESTITIKPAETNTKLSLRDGCTIIGAIIFIAVITLIILS